MARTRPTTTSATSRRPIKNGVLLSSTTSPATASTTRVSPALAAGSINAYADTDGNGILSLAEFTAGAAGTSTTDASGNYSIGGSTPGKYVVVRGPQGLVDPVSFPGGADECDRLGDPRR